MMLWSLGYSLRLRCDMFLLLFLPTRAWQEWYSHQAPLVLREKCAEREKWMAEIWNTEGKCLIRNNSSHQAQTIDSKLASGELFRHHGSQINRQKVRIESWQLFKWFSKVDYAQDFPRPYKGRICFAALEYSPCIFLPLSSMLHSVVSLQYMLHKMFFLLSAWGWAGWLTLLRKIISEYSL